MLPEWLWALVVGVVVLGLIGVVYKNLLDRIADLASDLSKLEGRAEQRWSEKDKTDRDWRHDTYAPAVDAINARLLPLTEQVKEIDRRVGRIERHLNGKLKAEDER